MKKETYIVIDYQELKELIIKLTNVTINNLPYTMGWNNDSCYDWSTEYDEDSIDEMKEFITEFSGKIYKEEYGFSVYDFLNWAAYNKHIEPGNYLIKVSW